jgi:hypothetical protein
MQQAKHLEVQMKKNVCLLILLGILSVSLLFADEEYEDITIEVLFYAYFNGTGLTPTDSDIDLFIQNVFPNEYRSYRYNEIQWARFRSQAVAVFEEGIANFNPDTRYWMQTDINIGAYNIGKEGFNIEMSNSFGLDPFILVMTNNRDFNLMPMDIGAAEEFLNNKTLWGFASRQVRLVILFKFADFTEDAFASLVRGRRGSYIHCLIEEIEVFNSNTAGLPAGTQHQPYYYVTDIINR